MYVRTALLAAAILAGGLTPTAQEKASTITGELITVMCYTGNGEKGRGDDHAACALKCAKEGYPLAVLTSDGDLYKLVGELTKDRNAGLYDLIAKTVVATGLVGEEGAGKTLNASSVVPAHE